jgi:hypothetical protein
MKKNYPDVSGLFKMKAEWRQRQASRPVTEKLEVAARLKQLSQDIQKLTSSKKQMEKIRTAKTGK